MKLITEGETIRIPAEVAVCPICGAEVVIEIFEWEEREDGWAVSEGGLKPDCITCPDVDDDEWEEWFGAHWSMPYVDWLPIEVKVLEWINSNYRFKNISG